MPVWTMFRRMKESFAHSRDLFKGSEPVMSREAGVGRQFSVIMKGERQRRRQRDREAENDCEIWGSCGGEGGEPGPGCQPPSPARWPASWWRTTHAAAVFITDDKVSLRETKVRVGSGPQKPHKAQKELGGGGKLSKECPQMCSLFPHPYVWVFENKSTHHVPIKPFWRFGPDWPLS